MRIIRVGISGGPAAGKTEVLDLLREEIMSYNTTKVFYVEEVATYLMKMGLAGADPTFELDCLQFQELIENWLVNYIQRSFSNDVTAIIIYDRTAYDCFAYAYPSNLLKEYNLDDFADRYDMIIHLQSAAEHIDINNSTNPYRIEDSTEAIMQMDFRTYEFNKRHPRCVFIPYKDDIEDKASEIIDLINELVMEGEDG